MTKPRFEIAVGLFVVLGFVILSMIVFFVSGIYFFRPGYHLTALFDYVGIIGPGAPVRYSGVRVGEVSGIRILKPDAETKKARIELSFFVEKGVEVRERDEVSIRGTHIMSEPHIAITPAPDGGRALKDGDVIADGVSPFSTDDLLKQGDAIAKKLDGIFTDVSGFLQDKDARAMLRQSIQDMSRLLASLNTMFVGKEEEYHAMVTHLNRVSEQMEKLLEQINQGEGTLGRLVTQDELYIELRDFVRELRANPWKLFKKS